MADRDIAELLADMGFVEPSAQRVARTVLEAEGLTNPRKSRISTQKLSDVRAILRERCARACSDPYCQHAVRRAKPDAELVVVADAQACDSCLGSDNRRAANRFLQVAAERGVRRLVVVGGAPKIRQELGALLGSSIDLRLVDGTERRLEEQARRDLAWGDIVLISGSSQLAHKVSSLYSATATHREKVVLVHRRGVAALLDEASRHAAGADQ